MRHESRAGRVRFRVQIRGLVQGVGFRPFVHALAHELGLSGFVSNDADGVVLEVEGGPGQVEAFTARVRADAPPLAQVDEVLRAVVPLVGGTDFAIHESTGGPGHTYVSPDVATCADCLDDLRDPGNRRYRHPFVSCTNCGPRFTIVTGLPYDRPATTMAGFPLCADCSREYADPADRRFHAQPICCPACGPRLTLHRPGRPSGHDEAAIAETRRLLADGAIVAVKGLGGFHLACDARQADAVATLRCRKRRGDKPFAVMVADAATAARVASLDADAHRVLTSHQRPIVLLPRLVEPGLALAADVAPGNPDLGVMLAYTPLHHILLGLGDDDGPAVLVMTSGNVAGEPIVTADVDAHDRLADLADAWLGHDRPIHTPCDDTVLRVVDGAVLPVRRSRGYAPMPVHLPFSTAPVLAVGGDLKNTFALAEGRRAWLSAHVGDMDDYRTQQGLVSAERHLEALTGIRPESIVADLHPGYRTHRWADDHAGTRPVALVQHHHAHVASTMADAGHDGSRRVLGVAFDGTGYGDDGAVWGGEFLLADYATYHRRAHLSYVSLPGGDAGVRNPCRMALSHLRAAGVAWEGLPSVAACTPEERAVLERQLDTGFGTAPTSSMGRLFDAVASLVGLRHRVGYEAQAAIELEGAARPWWSPGLSGYRFPGPGDDGAVDCAPVIAGVADDVRAGRDPGVVAARFHQAVVGLVTDVAERVGDESGIDEVTLSGGVFVNTLLTSGCRRSLTGAGFRVLAHRTVPPTDAGLALGQVAVHAHRDMQRDATSYANVIPSHEAAPPSESELTCA